MNDDLLKVGLRLAGEPVTATEADIQSDIKMFLMLGEFGLADYDTEALLEAPAGGGCRIDVLSGRTVIEVKKRLDNPIVTRDAGVQLRGYINNLNASRGFSHLGVLTDGKTWLLYQLDDSEFVELGGFSHKLSAESVERLELWLEAIMALSVEVPATPTELINRVGRDTPSYDLAVHSLRRAWKDSGHLPSIALKRQLWDQMCSLIFGTSFEDPDDLFFDHTYLILMTKVIAHKLLGLDLLAVDPQSIVEGTEFAAAGIYGVIDSDIFDWVLEAGALSIVEDIARRIQHFNFRHVEHDLLKFLYEGVIAQETRKKLGEYYTPDWLAELIVNETIEDPLHQRVLDPSCGSGTFVFHAVRRYLDAAVEAGVLPHVYLARVQTHVFGMDLHPVAVQLAKVTWLLAIGEEHLTLPNRPELHAPISLGDSVQWQTGWTSIVGHAFEIRVETGGDLLSPDRTLNFPVDLLDDLPRFEGLLDVIERHVRGRLKGGSYPEIGPDLSALGIPPEWGQQIQNSTNLLCDLDDEGRNHIWTYFIRNQARPAYFRRNPVDVIVGNPPWLSYRFMDDDMQRAFKTWCRGMNLWSGGAVATQQDLSAFFLVRSVEAYLRADGKVAMVMPFAVLSRRQFAGFRSGDYEVAQLRFERPWSLKHVKPLFPVPASVVFGAKVGGTSAAWDQPARLIPEVALEFSARLPCRELPLKDAADHLSSRETRIVQINSGEFASLYSDGAHQGATIVPRVFFSWNVSPPVRWARLVIRSEYAQSEVQTRSNHGRASRRARAISKNNSCFRFALERRSFHSGSGSRA